MCRKMLKRFYEKDKIGIIEGKLSAVKNEKACLVEVSIANIYRPEKQIAWCNHLWIETSIVDNFYDYKSNIVRFNFKAYKYSRLNGTEDYSVIVN